jgi:hypothetical protein
VLSGYVAGYTGTEAGAHAASPRIKPEAAYTVSRVAGFYPLFILVQLLFAPMFIFADAYYNGPVATALHGFMSATLVQVGEDLGLGRGRAGRGKVSGTGEQQLGRSYLGLGRGNTGGGKGWKWGGAGHRFGARVRGCVGVRSYWGGKRGGCGF